MASSVSREAYGEASDQLAANTAAATAPQLATVADEILSVAGLLRAQPRLRRALTDPSPVRIADGALTEVPHAGLGLRFR